MGEAGCGGGGEREGGRGGGGLLKGDSRYAGIDGLIFKRLF